MQEGNKTVTLTSDQYWIIRLYLQSEIRELEQLYKDAEDAGYEDGEQVFGYCLESLKDALNALSKWGGCAK